MTRLIYETLEGGTSQAQKANKAMNTQVLLKIKRLELSEIVKANMKLEKATYHWTAIGPHSLSQKIFRGLLQHIIET